MRTNQQADPAKITQNFILYTNAPIFLTGKAGTGKTTFLKSVADLGKKQAIAAPTAIAASNAGGMTLNSLFRLPEGLFVPENQIVIEYGKAVYSKQALLKEHNPGKETIQLLNDLELVIIDEASMLRPDMLDAIDTILRNIRQFDYPFGGIQLLFVGDLYQLPPVISDSEWDILKKYYSSKYFFDAKVFADSQPVVIELTEVHRQSDQLFINLLDNIRKNAMSESDFGELSKRYKPHYASTPTEVPITLTTHNSIAEKTNQEQLDAIPGVQFEFPADINGLFDKKALQADVLLKLKIGAKIIFRKNDPESKRYYNGKMGAISKIDNSGVYVKCEGEEEFKLEKETWRNIIFKSSDNASIEEQFIGQCQQYPISLAWAITIHKSQGLTFEKAIVDTEKSFESGQIYVALSRLKTIDGLILRSPIDPAKLHTDDAIVNFMDKIPDKTMLESIFEGAINRHVLYKALRTFDFLPIQNTVDRLANELLRWKLPDRSQALILTDQLLSALADLNGTAENFRRQLVKAFANSSLDHQFICDRSSAAKSYFENKINTLIIHPLDQHLTVSKGFPKYETALANFKQVLIRKQKEIDIFCDFLNQAAINGNFQTESEKLDPITYTPKATIKNNKKRDGAKKNPDSKVLKMLKDGMSLSDIAVALNVSGVKIENDVLVFVESGLISASHFISSEKLEIMCAIIGDDDANSNKEKLGNGYSFFEIKLAMRHQSFLNKSMIAQTNDQNPLDK